LFIGRFQVDEYSKFHGLIPIGPEDRRMPSRAWWKQEKNAIAAFCSRLHLHAHLEKVR
jgi:hypothetical protein